MVNSPHRDRGIDINPDNLPLGLKTNTLTRDQKRNHLARLNIKGKEAELILDKLYGKE